jgi:hypothetical protein
MQLEFMADVPTGDAELYLYLDEAGLQRLVEAVEAARRAGHEHLMTERWGGTGLTISERSNARLTR